MLDFSKCIEPLGQGTSLCMTPRVPEESCTVRNHGPAFLVVVRRLTLTHAYQQRDVCDGGADCHDCTQDYRDTPYNEVE